jgi:hypothetical protein
MTRWIEIGDPRAYGLGLTRFDEFGPDAWGHGATAPASTPTPGVCPKPGVTVVVLSNLQANGRLNHQIANDLIA